METATINIIENPERVTVKATVGEVITISVYEGGKGDKGDDGGDGVGIASSDYNASTGVLTLTFTDATTFSTGDLRGAAGATGNGIASSSYNSGTGVLTITYTNGATFSTGDLRGAAGAAGADSAAADISYYRRTGAGYYFNSAITPYTASTVAIPQNSFRFVPFIVSKSITADRIAVNITIGGTAGSVCRLGIYDSNNSMPNNRIIDAGTIACDSTGVKEITINQALAPGLYFLCLVHNSSGSNVTFSNIPVGNLIKLGQATVGSGEITSYLATFTYAALPANTSALTFTTGVTGSVSIWLRL